MKKIFLNKRSELRSGWKVGIVLSGYFLMEILLFASGLILFMVYAGTAGHLPGAAAIGIFGDFFRNPVVEQFLFLVDSLVLIFVIMLALRVMDHQKRLTAIGLTEFKKGYRGLIAGFLLGALSITAVFLFLLSTENILLENGSTNPRFPVTVLTGLLMFLGIAFKEELFSRGYCIYVFNQTGKLWWSVFLSALLFSGMHSLNPNVNLIGLINILLAGLLFSWMFIRSGSLWMPIGYHLSWNYFQGSIFGFPVSGKTLDGIWQIKKIASNRLTGGDFGPEGGLAVTVILLIGFIAVWIYTGKRKPEQSFARLCL